MERIKRFQRRKDDLSHPSNWFKFFLYGSWITWPLGVLLMCFRGIGEPLVRPKKVRVLDSRKKKPAVKNAK